MTSYCTEDDMAKIRPKIMELGVDGWDDQIAEADDIIDRALESRWYRNAAADMGLDYRETPFNRALLLEKSKQCTRLGCYKTLELAYLFLMKDAKEADAFERQSKSFRELYIKELSEVLGSGLTYDWDESGVADDISEVKIPSRPRLVRC